MSKKLKGKALEKFEADRDVWQEVLDGVREIKAGVGRRKKVTVCRNSWNFSWASSHCSRPPPLCAAWKASFAGLTRLTTVS